VIVLIERMYALVERVKECECFDRKNVYALVERVKEYVCFDRESERM
jgi:hypothetical protein